MRRVNCRRCGTVAIEEVPWGDGKRTLTKAYMLFLARWARRLSWKQTAEAFRTSWEEAFQQLWDYNSPAWAGKFPMTGVGK
jgi:transposase